MVVGSRTTHWKILAQVMEKNKDGRFTNWEFSGREYEFFSRLPYCSLKIRIRHDSRAATIEEEFTRILWVVDD